MSASTESRRLGRFRPRRRVRNTSGEMSLVEHLRELRSRLLKAFLAIGVGMIIGWVYYEQLFDFLREPYDQAAAELIPQGQNPNLTLTGITDPFTLQLQVAAITGIVLASPFWLFQLWRFVTPGLHNHERRYGYAFVAVATPLFLAGAWLAYVFMPQALSFLIGFTPQGVENLIDINRYLDFFIRTVLVFGFMFVLPLMLVLLNAINILTGRRLLSWWRGIIFAVFVIAALVTPGGDPGTMLVLGGSMCVLVGAAIIVCILNDKRRGRLGGEGEYEEWDDEEASPLAPHLHNPADNIPSRIGTDDDIT